MWNVTCVTLPQVLEEHAIERVRLLKLDCEGSEYEILRACAAETLDRIDYIVLEIHESPGIPHARQDLIDFLAGHGFSAEIYDGHYREGLATCMGFFQRR